jgi:hypothetical protein
MRIRTITATALLALALTACGSGSSDDDKASSLTAQSMVDQLAELYPLPHPRDNTGSCNTDDSNANSCKQLITTDPVSVYELKTEQAAAHWTKSMNGINKNKAVQAGRFMLLWKAAYPSDQDAVDEMTAKAKELAAAEK